MIKTVTLKGNEQPSPEQLREVMEASEHPIVFDEDAPELSPAMIKAFKCSVAQRNRRLNVQ